MSADKRTVHTDDRPSLCPYCYTRTKHIAAHREDLDRPLDARIDDAHAKLGHEPPGDGWCNVGWKS